MISQFNKIILPQGIEDNFYVVTDNRDDKIHFAFDPYSFNYIIEEFISRGAVYLGILPNSGFSKHLESYDRVLKERTVLLDKKKFYTSQLNSIFKPIAAELEIDINQCEPYGGINYQRSLGINEKDFIKEQVYYSFAIAYENLYQFLIGINEGAQISIVLSNTLVALNAIKEICKDPRSTRNCSLFIGILSSYKELAVPSIEISKSSASLELVQHFKYFIKDEYYLDYSSQNFNLGKVGIKTQQLLDGMKRSLSRLFQRESFKDTFDMGSKVLSKSTGIPIPTTKDLDGFVEVKNYMPPIINVDDILRTARLNWEKKTNSLGFVDGFNLNPNKTFINLSKTFKYSIGNGTQETITYAFDIAIVFKGSRVHIYLNHKDDLNEMVLNAFKKFHNTNFQTPYDCSLHKRVFDYSSLGLIYGQKGIECYLEPCCEESYLAIIGKLFFNE